MHGELKRMASVTGQWQKWDDFAEGEHRRIMSPVIVIAIVLNPPSSLLSVDQCRHDRKMAHAFSKYFEPSTLSLFLRPIDRRSHRWKLTTLFLSTLSVFFHFCYLPLYSSQMYELPSNSSLIRWMDVDKKYRMFRIFLYTRFFYISFDLWFLMTN